MKRFAIVCALVLLLNVLCPVGHMHAEEISTPTDVECTHPQYEMTDYTSDNTHHWRECPDCGEKLDMLEHNDKCYPEGAGVCNDCGRTDVTFGFTGHGYIDMDTYSSDTYMHWNVCEACGEKINANYHVGTAGGDCTVCGAPYACAHAYGQYEFDDTHHWFACEGCGENVNKEEHDAKPGDVGDNCTVCGAYVAPPCDHWRYCNEAICGACGKEYTGENIQHPVETLQMDLDSHWYYCPACKTKFNQVFHSFDAADYYHDTQWHWFACDICGVENGREMHTVTCENAALCTVCGFDQCAVGDGHQIDYSTFQHDDTQHWYGCTLCDYRESVYPHITTCANPGVCKECGVTFDYDKDEIQHTVIAGGEYTWDQYQHYEKCLDCGQAVYGDVHNSDCSDPDKCLFCGADGVTVAYVDHWNADSDWSYDDQYHWYYCSDCQGKAWAEPHSRQHGDPEVCNVCGAPYSGDEGHIQDSSVPHNETTHESQCAECGEIYKDMSIRGVLTAPTCTEDGLASYMCDLCWSEVKVPIPATGHAWGDPVTVEATCTTDGSITTTCTACGEKTVETIAAGHQIGYTYDDTMHYLGCKNCDYQIDSFWHYDHCDNQGVCFECGATDVTFDFTGHELLEENVRYNQDEHWWVCSRCEQEVNHIEHMALCTEPDVCFECGASGVTLQGAMHENWTMEGNAEKHWESCSDCGLYEEGKHVDLCTNPDGKCEMCGEACGEEALNHLWKETSKTEVTCLTDGVKKYTCEWCKKTKEETTKATGKHTWGETVTVEATCVAAGSKTTACTVCGEKTVETIPPTGKHTWETVSQTYATCTKAGRTERICTVCDELSITTQDAKGHAYGLVFITEGNGTHAKTCETCGAKHVEDCVLTSTEMGNMVCSACATCGYAVYTMADSVLEEVEGLTETKAEIEVKRVENVSFEIVAEPAVEGTEAEAEAEPTETADVVLVVHETELEMTVELPDTVNASVKKVLAVSMLKEGSAIQPTSKVKLSIPVVEEKVAGMKLVLMGENGELIEIEYEIIDGVIVFETDMVGIFLFVEAEA